MVPVLRASVAQLKYCPSEVQSLGCLTELAGVMGAANQGVLSRRQVYPGPPIRARYFEASDVPGATNELSGCSARFMWAQVL